MSVAIDRPDLVSVISSALCKSKVFETGQGTCALVCMDQLGDPRKRGCYHADRVHDKIALAILEATAKHVESLRSHRSPMQTKKTYLKPFRTIVELDARYADRIRDLLNASGNPPLSSQHGGAVDK